MKLLITLIILIFVIGLISRSRGDTLLDTMSAGFYSLLEMTRGCFTFILVILALVMLWFLIRSC